MSMRVPGGEENYAEPSSKALVRAVEGPSNQSSSASDNTSSRKYDIPPLLRIFTSKEIVPVIFEYEKAILVMKEHDYARVPERKEVLKLSSLLDEAPLLYEEQQRDSQPPGAFSDLTMLLNTRKDLIQFRASLPKREDGMVTDHHREVIGLQIDLIREQQEQLHDKDKELCTVRKDKEQLEARLERMERRLAILKKHSRSKYDHSDSEYPHTQQVNTPSASSDTVGANSTPKIRSHRDSLLNSEQCPRSRSNSNDRGSRPSRSSRVSSHSSTPVPQDSQDGSAVVGGMGTGKRNQKRKSSDNSRTESSAKKKKSSKLNEIHTKLEYTGLGLPVSPQMGSDVRLFDKPCLSHCTDDSSTNNAYTANSLVSSTTSSISGHSENGRGLVNGTTDTDNIVVPSWKTCLVKPPDTAVDPEGCEDLSDDSFTRRHRKSEEDEKRRKRWDVQRARALRNHEELLRKYNQKGAGGEKPEKKKERIVSFLPKLSEIETLEIKDTITVTAFGVPLPLVKPREFELSWFDLEKREAAESIRTTRSMMRTTTRTSAGSSAEEDTK